MRTFITQKENNEYLYILFDSTESIVELPTKFLFSLKSRGQYSPQTISTYLSILKIFCESIEQDKYYKSVALSVDDALSNMDSRYIEEWLLELKKQGLSPYTIRSRDVVLKGFFEWLTTKKAGRVYAIDDHPYGDNKLKTRSPHRPLPRFITHIELCDLLNELHNESERCLLHFMFDTGLRISEVVRMKRSDLPEIHKYPDRPYFRLLVQGSKGKAGYIKERYTLISKPVAARIYKLHNNWKVYWKAQLNYKNRQDMPMFLNVKGKPITTECISKTLQRASNKLIKKGIISQPIHAHRLRHGMALSVLSSEMGNDVFDRLVLLQTVLGHNSIGTTETYAQIPPIDFERNLKALSTKFDEADYIFQHTYKSPGKHTERRGHKI